MYQKTLWSILESMWRIDPVNTVVSVIGVSLCTVTLILGIILCIFVAIKGIK